jgi:hypothetical protein
MDFILLTSSIIAGGLSSIVLNSLLRNGFNRSKKKSKSLQTLPSQMEVEELESLKIEKNILEESMVKIYEAYKAHKISKLEYDRLEAKYTEDIRICDERFQDLQASVDITELRDLRKDLVSLVESKIKNIDDKLNKVSSASLIGTSKGIESVHLDTVVPTSLGKQIKRTAALEHARIGKLHKEVLDAVAKLDRPIEDHSSTVSEHNEHLGTSGTVKRKSIKIQDKDRDALGNFG